MWLELCLGLGLIYQTRNSYTGYKSPSYVEISNSCTGRRWSDRSDFTKNEMHHGNSLTGPGSECVSFFLFHAGEKDLRLWNQADSGSDKFCKYKHFSSMCSFLTAQFLDRLNSQTLYLLTQRLSVFQVSNKWCTRTTTVTFLHHIQVGAQVSMLLWESPLESLTPGSPRI